MKKYFKLPFRDPTKNIFLARLREQLLNKILIGSFIVGSVLFIFALIPTLQNGLYVTILIYSLLYVWTMLITFIRRLPYLVRTIGWLGILYAFGCINLINSGFNLDSGLFFMLFIVMAILLLDLQGGLVAILLSSIAIVIMAYENVFGHYQLPMGLPQSNPLLWLIGGSVFLVVGLLLIYALTIVVHGLDRNLAKAKRLANEIFQTNQSLNLSEARYRTLVETSPGLVALLDLNGDILMTNRVGLALFGYKDPEEMVGRNMQVFVAAQDRSRVWESFQRTIQGGLPNDLECLGIRKDGSQFFAEFNGTLVADVAGMPQSILAIGRDITERKAAEQILRDAKDVLARNVVETKAQLKQASDRLEELVKHGPAVILSFLATNYAITYISENVAALLGYEAHHFIEDPDFWRNHIHPEDIERVFPQMDLVSNQERYIQDYRFLKQDGTYCWLHGERVLVRDAQGHPLEYIGSWSDITALKNKEETLRFFQDRYRSLYESMMDAYVSVDMEGSIQQFNLAYLRMLDYTSEELHELTYLELTPEKWHDLESGIVRQQVIPRGYSDIYEKEYIRKDGTVFAVELRTNLTRDTAGNPSGMWAIVRDISERKRIEENLRESEERYRNLLEDSLQGMILFQDGRIAYVNKAVTESLGYTLAELENLPVADVSSLMHPDDRSIFLGRLQQRLDGVPIPERYSIRVLHKNGETHWLETRTTPIQLQRQPAVIVTFIDVSDIRKAQAELEESAKVQQTILNASEALVCLLDKNGTLIASNDKFAERMRLKSDQVKGTSIYNILPEEVLRARKIPFDQVISSGKPVTFVDSREETWFENSLYPILDESGEVVSVAVYARDITGQRRVSEALRASEEQYRTLAETAHDMIFTINRDGRIGYVNSFGAKFLGMEPQELVGQPRAKFFPNMTSQHQEENILSVFATGEAIASESKNIFPKGIVWLHTWLVPLKDATGEITSVLGISRDITERKKAEETLQQARDQLEERVAERTRELSASQEQLRHLTAQTVKAQEDERRSISRELHDEAGQALITLKYDLAKIQNELPETDTLSRRRLSDSMKTIDQTMLHIRALAHSLRPPVLDIGGIHLSLQEYCREVTDRTRIPISYEGVEIPELSDEIGISLFRFVQEALTNIMKHAQASKVKVKLQYRKGEINLSVSDNGRGIADIVRKRGAGLLGITERLSLIGGKLEILSQEGRGVKLVARVPWVRPKIK